MHIHTYTYKGTHLQQRIMLYTGGREKGEEGRREKKMDNTK